jgi:hypothetical protein
VSETSRERVARNQAAYRKVNEAIRGGRDDVDSRPRPFVCECAVLGCNELVEMTIADYEEIRGSSDRFVIFPGHDVPDAERVVAATDDGAVVVEKDSDLAPITRRLDERR